MLDQLRQQKWFPWAAVIFLVLLTLISRVCVAYFLANDAPGDGVVYARLARNVLEQGMTFPTEPDIMLRVPGQAIVLIEAKFGSSNPRLADKKNRFGAVTKFLNRYKCKDGAADPLDRKWISEQEDDQILEQLCRNSIFAHWLALGREQPFVINLITRKATSDERFFRQHLAENDIQFRVRRWEDLGGLSVIQGERAAIVMSYLKNKTMNLSSAFDLQ